MERDGSEHPQEGSDAAATGRDARLREMTERILALEEERDRAESEGDQAGQASALRKLGDLNRAAGATDAARESYSRSRYLFQMLGNAESAAGIVVTLGNMESRARRFEAAARAFHEASDLYKRMAVPDKMADVLLSEADALLSAGKQPAALERIDEAGAIFAELDDTLGQAHTAFRLGMIAVSEEPETADVHLELAERLYGDHVGRAGQDIDVTLPPKIGDSRRYPPFVMQRVCLREREKLMGDEPTARMPKRATSAAALMKRRGGADATGPKESSMATWIGVGMLFIGTLALLVPQLVGEVEVLGRIVDWVTGFVSGNTLLHVGVGVFGAVCAIVAAQQVGIAAPVVLLAVGIGFGMIFHEVSRTVFASLAPATNAKRETSKAARAEREALASGKAAAERVLVAAAAALERGEVSTARSMYSEAYKISSEVFDAKGKLRALEAILELELEHGTMQSQVNAAELLYDDLRGVDALRGREVLEQIVSLGTRLDDLGKVRDAQLRLLAHHEKVGDVAGEVAALMALAAIDRDTQDLEGSYEWYRRAHAGYQSLRDVHGQVGTLLAMGEIDARLGRRRRAYGSYYHAFAIYRETGDRGGQATMLLHMGALDEASERYEEAIAAFRQAQRIYASLGDSPGEALAALRFGSTQVAHGNQRQARDGFLRSLELYGELGDVGGQARARLGLGHHWLKVGRRQEALRNYEEARLLYQREDDPRGQLAALREMALIAHQGGSGGSARERFEEARRVTRGVGDPSVRASLLLSAGDLALSLDRPEDAASTYREALALYEDIGDDPGRRAASERLSHANAAG